MSEGKRAQRQRIGAAISRLAALFPHGELLAATQPDVLINQACDEIEKGRRARKGERR